jgi:hypothetical protein
VVRRLISVSQYLSVPFVPRVSPFHFVVCCAMNGKQWVPPALDAKSLDAQTHAVDSA